MRITAEWLERHEACYEQAHFFGSIWPDGMDVTLENLQQAQAAGLDVFWLEFSLRQPFLHEYIVAKRPAFDEYSKIFGRAADELRWKEALIIFNKARLPHLVEALNRSDPSG